MTEYQRYISQRVLTDQQPVTFKLISRHFNIHVNDSKKILYTFLQNNKDTCTATYIITGLVNDKKQIRFTNDLQKKSEFDSITSVQVYSVKSSKSALSLNDIVSSVNEDLNKYPTTLESCAKWGIIKCPELIIQEEKIATPQTSRKHDIKKEEPKAVKKQATDSNSSSAKKDPFAISSLYKSRKKQLETAPVTEKSNRSSYQYVSRKNLSGHEPKSKPSAKKLDSDLQALFDDDDDDFKDETFEEDKKESTPIEIESVEDTPEDPVDSPKSIPEVKVAETEVETDTQDRLEEPEIDEDGYIVTKKKLAPTTKSSRKVPPPTKKLATTPLLLTNNKQKKQSSLMSFFGKR